MCDVPSIAVFCSESIECFPGAGSKFFLKLLVTIPVAPIFTGIIVHSGSTFVVSLYINSCNLTYYHYYYYYYRHHNHLLYKGIYTYIPETNYVHSEYIVAAILLLLFMVLISLVSVLNLLYFYISTFRIICAVPNMAVFCNSLTSQFPGMLLTYFLNDFEIVPVAPIITGITFAFIFHMRCISIVRSLYFRIFSVSFLITFLSPEITTSINIHVPGCLLSRSLLLGASLESTFIPTAQGSVSHCSTFPFSV